MSKFSLTFRFSHLGRDFELWVTPEETGTQYAGREYEGRQVVASVRGVVPFTYSYAEIWALVLEATGHRTDQGVWWDMILATITKECHGNE